MKTVKILKGIAKEKVGIKTPLIVSIALTFHCNLKCRFCGIWKARRKEMTTEQVKKLIRDFSKNGMQLVIFTGGEPLLRKDIGELVDYAKSLGVYTHIVTNGNLIKNRIEEIKNVDSISVSIDGPKDINDLIRGKGSFEKALEGIKAARRKGLFVHIMSSIWKGNVENNCYGIHKLLEISENLGCKINFQPIYTDQYNLLKDKSYFPSKKEVLEALSLIEDYKKRTNNIIASQSYFEWIRDYDKKEMKCYAGRLFCYVFPDGLVVPCFFKEELGVNGLEKGFMNAFNNMPEIKKCKCLCHGYSEYNLCFSLNIKSILNAAKQISGFI